MNNDILQKKISVIVPTYNRDNFISSAIKSIVDQHYENIEIIIVDDGSDDNTQAVVAKLMESHTNIIYCHNECSKGPSGARNTGIMKASGDYLSFLDSDDVWMEGHLISGEIFLKEYPEIDVLFGNVRIVDKNSGEQFNYFDNQKILHTIDSVEVTSRIKILRGNLFEALIQSSFFLLGSVIVKRSAAKGILLDELIMYSEDRDFAINLYKQASARFAVREDPVVIQYRHDANICNNVDIGRRQLEIKRKISEAHLYLYEKYLSSYDLSSHERRLLNKLIANKLSNVSYDCWINREYRNYLSYMLKSFKYYLTYTQFRNLLKVIIYPFIRNRYHKFHNETVQHTIVRGH